MLKNEEFLEQFKKSLSATVKSIGKSDLIEVNFGTESPSISGNVINLVEPDLKTIQKNLNYIRAEADAMALEVRFHQKKIHNKYLSQNDITNGIFVLAVSISNSVSVISAEGIFKNGTSY